MKTKIIKDKTILIHNDASIELQKEKGNIYKVVYNNINTLEPQEKNKFQSFITEFCSINNVQCNLEKLFKG